MVETFFQVFIPLFVAIDVIGVLPLFVGLTEGMQEGKRRRLIRDATITAFSISLVFLVAGKLVFTFMGITESDFRVGGGIVLLVLAVYELLFSKEKERRPEPLVGVVPIGIPLIMGPAALTTIILNVNAFGYVWAVASLLVNMAIVWVVFRQATFIIGKLGHAGALAVAKVVTLFLTGIAVMMIRSGVEAMVHTR
ncbi:MAG TPA: MarC family protein [Bacteroidota bacterium]|nr:MarC family protein [Bacteroidota bacterium]